MGSIRFELDRAVTITDHFVVVVLCVPNMGPDAVVERVVRVEVYRLRDVGDRLVPFLPIDPALRPTDVAIGIIRLELDDFVPVFDGTVIFLVVVVDDRHQRIRERISRMSPNAIRQVSGSVFQTHELIRGAPTRRSVVFADQPELIAFLALNPVDMDFRAATQYGLAIETHWEIIVALDDPFADPIIAGRFLGISRELARDQH